LGSNSSPGLEFNLSSKLLLHFKGSGLDGSPGLEFDLHVHESGFHVDSSGVSVGLPGIQDKDGSLPVSGRGGQSNGSIMREDKVGGVHLVFEGDVDLGVLVGREEVGFNLSVKFVGLNVNQRLGLLVEVGLDIPDIVSLMRHLGVELELMSSNSKESVVVETKSHGGGLDITLVFEVNLVVVVSDLQGVVNGGFLVRLPLDSSLSLEDLGSDFLEVVRVPDLSSVGQEKGSIQLHLEFVLRVMLALKGGLDVSVVVEGSLDQGVDLDQVLSDFMSVLEHSLDFVDSVVLLLTLESQSSFNIESMSGLLSLSLDFSERGLSSVNNMDGRGLDLTIVDGMLDLDVVLVSLSTGVVDGDIVRSLREVSVELGINSSNILSHLRDGQFVVQGLGRVVVGGSSGEVLLVVLLRHDLGNSLLVVSSELQVQSPKRSRRGLSRDKDFGIVSGLDQGLSLELHLLSLLAVEVEGGRSRRDSHVVLGLGIHERAVDLDVSSHEGDLSINVNKFSLVSSGLGLERDLPLSVDLGLGSVLVSSSSPLKKGRLLLVEGVDSELSLEDFGVDGGERLVFSGDVGLEVVPLLSFDGQLGVEFSDILSESELTFLFDGREGRALSSGHEFQRKDVSFSSVVSVDQERGPLLSGDQVLGDLLDLSVVQFVVDLDGLLLISRHVNRGLEIVGSKSEVLVQVGFERGIEVLLVKSEPEGVSEEIGLFFVRSLGREHLLSILSDVKDVEDLLSVLLSLQSKSIPGGLRGLSEELSSEFLVVLEVSVSFDLQNFLGLVSGSQESGLLVQIHLSFEGN